MIIKNENDDKNKLKEKIYTYIIIGSWNFYRDNAFITLSMRLLLVEKVCSIHIITSSETIEALTISTVFFGAILRLSHNQGQNIFLPGIFKDRDL